MHRGFGTVLRPHLWGCNKPELSRVAISTAIQEYFTEAFNTHTALPCFMVQGAITTPAGVTTPAIGPIGTISTFIPGIINPLTFTQKIKKEPFYVQLVSIITDFLRTCTVTVDIKNIGAVVPMMVPFQGLLNLTPFGQQLETSMKTIKAPNVEAWYAGLDLYFESIWTYILGTQVFYSSPCAGGVFNGTITFTGLSLAV